MSIVASDYDFGYDDKALFEKTYCYSAYEAFGVPSPLRGLKPLKTVKLVLMLACLLPSMA